MVILNTFGWGWLLLFSPWFQPSPSENQFLPVHVESKSSCQVGDMLKQWGALCLDKFQNFRIGSRVEDELDLFCWRSRHDAGYESK